MTDTPPIQVKSSAAPIVTSESFKVLAVGLLAVVIDRTMHSETAIVAAMAGAGVLATFLWSLSQRLRTWIALKFMASKLPDEVAFVGKPK